MFSKTMICHIYLFVQIVYFILWNIHIVSNLSGWNTIFSDMQIYRTFIHIVFLTYLTNGVAVLWFQVVELWQNPGWLLLEVPFRKIFLQFFSAHSDESHTQINRRYSSVMDILVERSPAHRVHRPRRPERRYLCAVHLSPPRSLPAGVGAALPCLAGAGLALLHVCVVCKPPVRTSPSSIVTPEFWRKMDFRTPRICVLFEILPYPYFACFLPIYLQFLIA